MNTKENRIKDKVESRRRNLFYDNWNFSTTIETNLRSALNVKYLISSLTNFFHKGIFPSLHILSHFFTASHKYFVVVFCLLRAFLLYFYRYKEAFHVSSDTWGCIFLSFEPRHNLFFEFLTQGGITMMMCGKDKRRKKNSTWNLPLSLLHFKLISHI